MKHINPDDPYGIQATAKLLDPAKCRAKVEQEFNKIRQSAGYKRKYAKQQKTDFNQEVLNNLIKLYGKNNNEN